MAKVALPICAERKYGGLNTHHWEIQKEKTTLNISEFCYSVSLDKLSE